VEKLASDSAGLDERELLRRYHEDGDLVARDVLVERMLPLVRSTTSSRSARSG
jgi:DNA-directed RNA polymerase specialized sigma subunit